MISRAERAAFRLLDPVFRLYWRHHTRRWEAP